MNHRDEPIVVSPDIEHNVSSNIVSIAKQAANFGEAVPSNSLYDSDPCLNFGCRVGILLQGLLQMFARHNVHISGYFTICEGVNGEVWALGVGKTKHSAGEGLDHTSHISGYLNNQTLAQFPSSNIPDELRLPFVLLPYFPCLCYRNHASARLKGRVTRHARTFAAVLAARRWFL
jgi:hypothetical protein